MKQEVEKKRFYFMKDIRAITGRSTSTIIRWEKRGEFPKPRLILGRKTWLVEKVEKWFAEQAKLYEA